MISGGLKANQFTQTRLIFEAKWNNDPYEEATFFSGRQKIKV